MARTNPTEELKRLQTVLLDTDTKASIGEYETAHAVLVLAEQVARVADDLEAVTFNGAVKVRLRQGGKK